MQYLCKIMISGPEPDADAVSQMMDAVSEAIQAGWDAPRVLGDGEPPDISESTSDDDSPDGTVLDYRVLGYPGGAIILVVLDSAGDFAQMAVAIAGLAQHLTTWSPGLLEYAPDEIKISKLDKPYDDENWLPASEDADDDSERLRWHLAELLDDQLQNLAAEYLLACAIQSLWDHADSVQGRRAWDVVVGAVEDPWGRELTSALGVMLIRAARLENPSGIRNKLIVQGSGVPELAADLLSRARATGSESETDGWTDDEMRGHVLLERFMEEHHLLWNRIPDDEPPEETDDRSNSQLRALLWAGLRALATLTSAFAHVNGPWQILDALGDSALISIMAEEEDEQNQEDAEEDREEVETAVAAHVLLWLAMRHPEMLNGSVTDYLARPVLLDVSSFHQLFHAAMLMAGAAPFKAALAQKPAPTRIRGHIEEFARALAATEDNADELADPYDDMHGSLEQVLSEGPGLNRRIRYLLAVAGLAAQLTDSEVNPLRAVEGHVSTPRMLTHYLLVDPAMHAALVLHRHDDDAAIRARMLSLTAEVAPAAVGELAAEFPDLVGEDPRLEPASRTRARSWIDEALNLAAQHGRDVTRQGGLTCSADASLLIKAAQANLGFPDEWSVHRIVSAGAEAAASILHAAEVAERADEVFIER